MTIDFSILVVVYEDTIDTIHGKDSTIMKRLGETSYFDFLEEDLDSLGMKLGSLDLFQKQVQEPSNIKLLEDEGWRFSFKRHVKITTESTSRKY
jgi:hypothetical protein